MSKRRHPDRNVQAWEDQYTSNVGRETQLKKCGAASATFQQQLALCNPQLEALRTTSTQQAANIAKQQEALNTCVVSMAKAVGVEPLRIVSHPVRVNQIMAPMAKHAHVVPYLVLTNKVITPIRLLVSCTADIDVSSWVLGTAGMTLGGWGGRVTGRKNQFGIGILSPAWTPSNPLLVTVSSDTPLGVCSFDSSGLDVATK